MLSTDRVVHELYGFDEVVAAVTGRFGPAVAPGGVIDRGELAKRAFATDEDRAWLEGFLWPRVGERMMAWRTELSTALDPPLAAVVEVPLLFESGMEGQFDATIAVIVAEPVRVVAGAGEGPPGARGALGTPALTRGKSASCDVRRR